MSGSIKKTDKIRFMQAGKKYEVLEVGIYNPEEVQVESLKAGQVGYLVSNMKNSDEGGFQAARLADCFNAYPISAHW
jgi:GTP-binding protein LepA